MFDQPISSSAFNVLNVEDCFLAPIKFVETDFNVIAQGVPLTFVVATESKRIDKYFRFRTLPPARHGMLDEAFKLRRYCDRHGLASAESHGTGTPITDICRETLAKSVNSLRRIKSLDSSTVTSI